MSTIGSYSRTKRTLPAAFVILMAGILGAAAIEYLITHPDPLVWWRLEFLIIGTLSAGIAYGGYRLFDSGYEPEAVWGVLAWTILGAGTAAAVGGSVYFHQQLNSAAVAAPAFLFEFLLLTGTGVGLAFGVTRLRSTTPIPRSLTEGDPEDMDRLWAVASLVGGDSDALRQRWEILQCLSSTTTQETPMAAFIIELSKQSHTCFPDDENAVKDLLYEDHLPVLLEQDMVTINDELGTVQFTAHDLIGSSSQDSPQPPLTADN